jgi:hypothetical protein
MIAKLAGLGCGSCKSFVSDLIERAAKGRVGEDPLAHYYVLEMAVTARTAGGRCACLLNFPERTDGNNASSKRHELREHPFIATEYFRRWRKIVARGCDLARAPRLFAESGRL